jgi:hypothetical protein
MAGREAFSDLPIFIEDDGKGQLGDNFSAIQFCSLLHTLCHCSDEHWDGKEVFQGMMDEGIESNDVTSAVMLHGICRRAHLHPNERFERMIREAAKIFDAMSPGGAQENWRSVTVVAAAFFVMNPATFMIWAAWDHWLQRWYLRHCQIS